MENNMSQPWQCPSCGEMNSPQSAFCKKCGYTDKANNEKAGSAKIWKILIGLLALIIVAAGSFGGYYYWKKVTEKKQITSYLEGQQKVFSDSVSGVNGINSELNIRNKYADEENIDLVVEKIRGEKDKAEKLTSDISQMKNEYDNVKVNSKLGGLDHLLKNYFSEAEKISKKYSDFVIFSYNDARLSMEIRKGDKEFTDKFKREPATMEELIGFYDALKQHLEDEIAKYDKLEVPDGLQDYKKPIEDMRKMAQKIGEASEAMKKNDEQKLLEILGDIVSATNDFTVAVKKSNEIVDNHYSQIHDEFSSLRTKADKIKNEFIMSCANFEIQPLEYSIEGW